MPITLLPVTLIFAGALTLINVWLAMRVGQVRGRHKVNVGDGGNDAVIRRMRAHANFVEYAPFALALVGLIEFSVGTTIWLWIAAVAFLFARIAHAFGMDGGSIARGAGIAATLGLLIALAIWAIAIPLVERHGAKNVQVEAVPAG